METYSLREAAELCGVSLAAMRSRADRGSIETVMRGAQRRVPRSELERAGLLPDAEIRDLRREIADLQRELAQFRRLVADTEREREAAERQAKAEAEGRQRVVEAANRDRASRAEAEGKLRRLESEFGGAGPIRAWRLGAQIRRDRPDVVAPRERIRRRLLYAADRLRKRGGSGS
jgi:excisionase family DNA binding protein